ncbi:DNA repair protein RecN [Anaerococcus hydrogenalis]|uniref:DNA repair protein RecN n=2 Tax=Anaerococcus hydrogenalis TaxID=33029 RepID=F0GZR3_9FIRM|nr:DNA repair protein RecN [Anaerococcus hydrogenalis]EGC84443.1 DNA repair protein RecN [Anaerococcus hydrogenalis ACS-025-V-Sch4]MDK7694637.1 DNA repair protein RecN [Anaerococcus hydrogenalis]MDK7696415.1 DNA repair protein RecN [Anaerococcus hydrogenalis]MDK7707664.1 DNA repair protein RecN [Anaerococcus hydrogenalis]PMC82675.1 DNA repair protein RecN [Anaerococcus hydrogenalis]
MLAELFINNFVIIKRDHLFFDKGFNVFTGETGSGKSLILDAINIVLGKRANKDVIGKFDDKTIIEAVFILDDQTLKKLENKDIIFDDNKLIITRTISQQSSSIRLNNRAVNLSMVKEIATLLIDIYKQGDSNIFMDKDNYLNIIDSYQKNDQSIFLKEEIKSLYNKKNQLLKKFDEFNLSQEEVLREKELINYQLDDIEQIDLENIDEEAIYQEYKKLNSVTELRESIEKSEELISSFDYDQATISSLLAGLSSNLSEFSSIDKEIEDVNEKINTVIDLVNEIYSDLDGFKDSLDQNPERLYELEMINQKIFDLKRKYGNEIEDILKYHQKISLRLKELEKISDFKKNINKNIEKIDSKLEEYSKKLSSIRKEKSINLEKEIKKEIQSLNIKNGDFKVVFMEKTNIDSNGIDNIDFLIKTNKGEDLKSLSSTASGGEISRIVLSFKKIFADYDKIDTMIFDEIDQGISGRTAQIVGEKILDLSKKRQIIAISHLPQIASLSTNHILIEKYDQDDLTISNSKNIKDIERTKEIARLLAGVDITEKTIESAKEMLDMAENLRRGN